MLLALGSGVALLGLVGYGLAQSAWQARERAQWAARRDAQDLASALRALLRHPQVLAAAPPSARFAVRDGSVAVDPAVGWLVEAPAPAPDAEADERLREAQLAEFVQHDAPAAAARFDAWLAMPADDMTRLAALAAAAWQAQRAGDATRAAALCARGLAVLQALPIAALANPPLARATASFALLAAAREQQVLAALQPLLAALPPSLAAPTFARLAELQALPAEMPATARALQERRDLLARVNAALRTLPNAPTARAIGERLLLWFPADESAGAGAGAFVDRTWCASLPGLGTARASPDPELPPLPDRGRLVFGAAAADADEVVPGFAAVLPAALPDLPWYSSASGIVGGGALLIAVFAASAFAVLRAVRRETLAMRTRADFLTGVTHELKTPIASIRLVAEVLHDDNVPPARQREYFALLAAEAARLSALIDNVLDLGQMERGERAYDLRPCDLADVVRDAAAAFAPLAERAGMSLAVHAHAAVAPAVADPSALQQALFAVCENARKYAAAGQRLELTTLRAGDRFTIAVRDFGPGVPAAESEAIFARFQRGSRQRSGTIPGVGLGLYLARRIAQRHGGSLVCATPAEGPGAEFVFSLPLATN